MRIWTPKMVEENPSPEFPLRDPRGRGFRDRSEVSTVLSWIDQNFVVIRREERIRVRDAGRRVLVGDFTSSVAVPGFHRAAMDGFAVRGEETIGAAPFQPASFRITGSSRIGRSPDVTVEVGHAARIVTGAPIPPGADTVVKFETCRDLGDRVEVFEPTPVGRNISRIGEDVASGARILPVGRSLRPQDLAVITATGVAEIDVLAKPRVRILVTGDELLPAGQAPRGYQIPDANSVMLQALIDRDGGISDVCGPLPDDRNQLRDEILKTSAEADLILISGGSSTGPEDHAPDLVRELGQLRFHGLALRPASPTGLGFVRTVPVVLLPGNPVSCLCAYDLFAGRILRRLAGRKPEWPYPSIQAPLARKLSSSLGRTDYARVGLETNGVHPISISGASILSSSVRAHGFVLVPSNLEGHDVGDVVEVHLYDLPG